MLDRICEIGCHSVLGIFPNEEGGGGGGGGGGGKGKKRKKK